MIEARVGPEIEVVICTYNKATMLDRVLGALASQTAARDRWTCLVVNNNCTDATEEVVQRHLQSGGIPRLRSVREPVQGLTAARLCGVKKTTAKWIAYVDDDCLLEPNWIARALQFAEEQPDAGAFGGKVILDWEVEPPDYVRSYGYSYAEQDHGDSECRVAFLAGAGLTVNRDALAESGWTNAPLLADRVGDELVSGGDVEIVLRIAGIGRELWYVGSCALRHRIARQRTTLPYLWEINRNLGISQALADALVSNPGFSKWLLPAGSKFAKHAKQFVRTSLEAIRGRVAREAISIQASFALGYLQGVARILIMAPERRRELLGRAMPVSARNRGASQEAA
jgi:glycosyltransferase involved in cell wall biosynthesis